VELRARYGGKVPVAILDVDRPTAMLLTIRMNRAKGTHVAVRMSEIARELVQKHGLDPMEIAHDIGATKEELDVLLMEGVFEARNIKDYRYSKAWYPKETVPSMKPRRKK
jgi:hypothetical protein